MSYQYTQAEPLTLAIVDNLRRPLLNISYILREASRTATGHARSSVALSHRVVTGSVALSHRLVTGCAKLRGAAGGCRV